MLQELFTVWWSNKMVVFGLRARINMVNLATSWQRLAKFSSDFHHCAMVHATTYAYGPIFITSNCLSTPYSFFCFVCTIVLAHCNMHNSWLCDYDESNGYHYKWKQDHKWWFELNSSANAILICYFQYGVLRSYTHRYALMFPSLLCISILFSP